MNIRNLIVTTITIVLIGSLFAGTVSAISDNAKPAEPNAAALAPLANIRDYAAATGPDAPSYLIDAGRLYANGQGELTTWTEIALPTDVMAGVVATDAQNGKIISEP